MLVELFEGYFVNPELVAVVKETGESQCALFTAGQSAVDGGFSVPYAAADVVEQVNDACEEVYGETVEEEEPEDEEDEDEQK